jgi:hypothetical protein
MRERVKRCNSQACSACLEMRRASPALEGLFQMPLSSLQARISIAVLSDFKDLQRLFHRNRPPSPGRRESISPRRTKDPLPAWSPRRRFGAYGSLGGYEKLCAAVHFTFCGQEMLKAAPYDRVIGSRYHGFPIYGRQCRRIRRAPIPSRPVTLYGQTQSA